jgi:decaprenylphospho-beta-D-erythro-pentofuranosid-2-ulose 2-reductase
MVTAFASGLRQRLHKSGVSVLTVKPGFVDTPMTRHFTEGALSSTPDYVARSIVRNINGSKEIYVPWFLCPITLVIKAIPEYIVVRLKL